MKNLKIVSSIEINRKIAAMQESLVGYWADDRWDIRTCPLESAQELKDIVLRNRWINFSTIKNPWLKTELKFFYYFNLINEKWKAKTVWIRKGTVINSLIGFLDERYPNIGSISEVPLEKALIEYRTYLTERGIKITTTNKKLNKFQETIFVEADSYYITNLKQFVMFYQDYYFDGDEWDKDTWDRRKLNLPPDKVNPTQYEYVIEFKAIENEYFRNLTKRFCRSQLDINSFSRCKDYAGHLKCFFNFLSKKYSTIKNIKDIDRGMIEEYYAYLMTKGLSQRTINSYKASLSKLFDTMQLYEWNDAPTKKLIFVEDYGRIVKAKPRYIDEYVLEQLDKCTHKLPREIEVMLLVLRECGMRISELCTLKRGCLLQDQEGDWFLKYYQWKMKKEHTIPISIEIAEILKSQEIEVENCFGDSTEYLFPRQDGTPLKQETFRRSLNELAKEENITDRNGKLFRFQAHAFRHTVGTRMINNGVPQHIVQRFLGHESPEMTMRYAFIHDESMKKEFIKFKEKFVNNQGLYINEDEVFGNSEADNLDLQWFKKNINAQALPNGYCRLPIISGACPHANACLDCTHFCTTKEFIQEHTRQLNKSKEFLAIAKKNNWQRQVETNTRVIEKLEAIISSLKGE